MAKPTRTEPINRPEPQPPAQSPERPEFPQQPDRVYGMFPEKDLDLCSWANLFIVGNLPSTAQSVLVEARRDGITWAKLREELRGKGVPPFLIVACEIWWAHLEEVDNQQEEDEK